MAGAWEAAKAQDTARSKEKRRVKQQQNALKFATADLATGVRLHYAEQGDQTGEALIFLHGYSDSWFSFSRVLPLLSPEYHAFAFDQARAEAFAERLVDVLNSGAIALMTSIGHRTDLFDTIARFPPSTSEQLASAAKLNERYVREWLGAMVVGRIVEHDPEGGTYHLPQEHAAFQGGLSR